MNYFAHALPFLDRPTFVVGAVLPDLLSVVDRKIRLRSKHLYPFFDDPDTTTAELARGAMQHFRDDDRFHESSIFGQLSLELTIACRDLLPNDDGLRPRFLGHILVEIFLDATLIERHPGRLDTFYDLIQKIDAGKIQEVFNRIAPRQTDRLAPMIEAISQVRFLSDYADDKKLLRRLNQIMRRVRLEPLPDRFVSLMPESRSLVAHRVDELLNGIPTSLDEVATQSPNRKVRSA